jgi:hypothetical protein
MVRIKLEERLITCWKGCEVLTGAVKNGHRTYSESENHSSYRPTRFITLSKSCFWNSDSWTTVRFRKWHLHYLHHQLHAEVTSTIVLRELGLLLFLQTMVSVPKYRFVKLTTQNGALWLPNSKQFYLNSYQYETYDMS